VRETVRDRSYNRRMTELRFATPDDAASVLRFIRALAEYENEAAAVEVTEAVLRQQLSAANPPFECLIAELDGEPVGFALFFHSYSTWTGKQGLWLEDLFVLPQARQHGVGTALLRRIAAIARARECGRLEWSVLDWNELAQGFYTGLGARLMTEWRICRVTGPGLEALALEPPA
jgi:GNAT superfamily N-acetyltransferase